MRPVSPKRQKINQEAAAFRKALVEQVNICEICRELHRCRFPYELRQLCVHEIANGPDRHKALDKPYATLVLCWHCNGSEVTNKKIWPQPRQLAVLAMSRPAHYDLHAFNFLVNPSAPNRIAAEEVAEYMSDVFLVDEVAKFLRVDPRTVEKWIKDEELPAINLAPKQSRRAMWRVSRDNLQAFIDSRSTQFHAVTIPETAKIPVLLKCRKS